MTTWNARITEAREAKKMTKADLARACKVAPPTISDWESGAIKTLEAPNLLKICDALHVDPWWLLLGTDNGKAPITEEKTPLSREAKNLILWVERTDGLGDPARKLFGHFYQMMQVAHTIYQAQNPPTDADLDWAYSELTSEIAQTEGKKRAAIKHKKP